MIDCKAGDSIDYRVTWLEMDKRPDYDWPHQPVAHDGALIRAFDPPWWWFLSLYDAVGRDYAWTERHKMPREDLQAWIQHPDVAIYTLMGKGWPQGFFMLDSREAGVCELAYFGLVPEAVGTGQGTWLLKTAVLTGWSLPGTRKMTVNTCTLDHPRALAQYQRMGFSPVSTEVRSTVLESDHVFLQPLL
ncbi:GNAT family N-acetyltransferase [Pararhodobacter zhoushanensis]|uniref:GNAT family N-acetyltransferase n=1 Tax=Pararhodobacter zhoushanensis TaxID=2479545 RepID=UPI000F8E93E9|nr:GNAT family N-acetyltransferase [Pararhodobacter zhoushanensis]